MGELGVTALCVYDGVTRRRRIVARTLTKRNRAAALMAPPYPVSKDLLGTKCGLLFVYTRLLFVVERRAREVCRLVSLVYVVAVCGDNCSYQPVFGTSIVVLNRF